MQNAATTTTSQEQRLLSTQEAARYLSVSRWTVDRLRATGELHAIRYFKHLRFDRVDLDDFIERIKRT